ncbi:respiratory nitrate reductase 2 alpha chain [Escherichia coli]|uniref:Respiratory nitrate reductase 2 alpha chain n=1 Tax=Escherichia coli TaxID=562 RepID=A0A376VJG7_ECOLX|nr:respiratory nitrate reductase 2 alpha chain [Escherichia coli]
MSKLLDRFRYFKQKGDTFADGHGQVMHSNRDWRTAIASVGSSTKSCVPPTVLTVQAPVAGKSTLKMVW